MCAGPLLRAARRPRLLDAAGSGEQARGPVRTMVVRIRPGSAGVPAQGHLIFGFSRVAAAENSPAFQRWVFRSKELKSRRDG